MSGGRLKRSFLFAAGQPVLALTTTGRKSGTAAINGHSLHARRR